MIFDFGLFDSDLVEDFLQHYTLDAILEEIGKPVSYQLDTLIGDALSVYYLLDVNIYKPFTTYQLDTILVLDRNNPKFQESIINAIVWSCGRATEKLSEAISLMGLRLLLPYATSDDLDLYWAKILGMKRRYGEGTEDFRKRLSTRLAIMKSSGTKPECEAILNSLLGMTNAVNLKTYWPAEVRVEWNSFWAMKSAEANFSVISETLDEMLAAGVTWSTSFPYKQYNLDAFLIGKHPANYSIDAGISKEKYCSYLLRTDIFDTGSTDYDLDTNLEAVHGLTERLDALVRAIRSKTELLSANISEPHDKSYQIDGVLKQKKTKSYEVDSISEAKRSGVYRMDGMTECGHRIPYLLTTTLEADVFSLGFDLGSAPGTMIFAVI
jgi:hypothetical protein